mmetsp:Transcript_108730/g.249348  ORF Transcript_108730/g.249348 Transcript_108730/m.249348 type:complete len:1044 (+) Transcript_108730:79-3210(+)
MARRETAKVELSAFSLRSLTSVGGPSQVAVNTVEPVPIKTEFFNGRLLMMVRPLDSDPRLATWRYNDHFKNQEEIGNPMMVDVYLQGEFLVEPRGEVWFGFEMEEDLSLGFVMMTTAKVLLNLIRKMSKMPMHYSFGGGTGQGRECPHLVQPFRRARVMETPGNQPWPELKPGLEVKGDPNLKIRKGPVYTFAYNTNFLDLNTWEICHVSGINRVHLRNFWGTKPSHMVIYDLEADDHTIAKKRVYMDLECKATKIEVGEDDDDDDDIEDDDDDEESDDHHDDEFGLLQDASAPEIDDQVKDAVDDGPLEDWTGDGMTTGMEEEIVTSEDEEDDHEEDHPPAQDSTSVLQFVDADELQAVPWWQCIGFPLACCQRPAITGASFKDDEEGSMSSEHEHTNIRKPPLAQKSGLLMELPNDPQPPKPKGIGTLKLPWYIELDKDMEQSKGPMPVWFLIQKTVEVDKKQTFQVCARPLSELMELETMFGEYGTWLTRSQRKRLRIPKRRRGNRVTAGLRRRRNATAVAYTSLGLEWARARFAAVFGRIAKLESDSVGTEVLHTLLQCDTAPGPQGTAIDAQLDVLLKRVDQRVPRKSWLREGKAGSDQLTGSVLTVVSEGRLALEYLRLSTIKGGQKLEVFQPPVSKARLDIRRANRVQAITCDHDSFLRVLFLFEVDCGMLGSFVFCCRDKEKRDAWVAALRVLIQPEDLGERKSRRSVNPLGVRLPVPPVYRDRSRSGRWRPVKRAVLNDRRPNIEGAPPIVGDPCAVSVRLLEEAAKCDSKQGLAGLSDLAGSLKYINIAAIPASRRLCFWLNTFHALLLHAVAALGRPNSPASTVKLYSRASYLVGPHVLSLAEIEHHVIRLNLSRPKFPRKAGTARFLLSVWKRTNNPAAKVGSLYLQREGPSCDFGSHIACPADRRVNFALNWGNVSCLDWVPVFDNPDKMDEQLDAICKIVLASKVKAEQRQHKNIVVTLPYVCGWYVADAPELGGVGWLPWMAQYLSTVQATVIKQGLMADGVPVVKYLPYKGALQHQLTVRRPSAWSS